MKPDPSRPSPTIQEAQFELRQRFMGGFYGQLVSGILWLTSAVLATWVSAKLAILCLVLGGMFIFPTTDFLLKKIEKKPPLSPENSLHFLGMQVAFVLPLSMPLVYPLTIFRMELFYPAMMVLVGAHYLPFVFLYGMRMFLGLTIVLVGLGVAFIFYLPVPFNVGAWITAMILFGFSATGRILVLHEKR